MEQSPSNKDRLLGHTLLPLCVLGFGGDQDGDARVGIFPEREEIVIRGAGFGGVALHGMGSADLKVRQGANGFVEHNPRMVENLF